MDFWGPILFMLASGMAFVSTLFYWKVDKKNKELENKFKERLIEKYEQDNIENINNDFNNKSDIDLFNEAVQRGANALLEQSRNKGNK